VSLSRMEGRLHVQDMKNRKHHKRSERCWQVSGTLPFITRGSCAAEREREKCSAHLETFTGLKIKGGLFAVLLFEPYSSE
jgi:hypothetical protein